MSKKDWVVVAGLATIVVALTDYTRKQKWEDLHTVAAVIGSIATILGATG